MIIIQLASRFGKEVRRQVFKNSVHIAKEIALQNVKLCAVLRRTDEQLHILHTIRYMGNINH